MKTLTCMIRTDIRLAFRQRIVIFFNYLMPLAFFFIFAQLSHAEQRRRHPPDRHHGHRHRHRSATASSAPACAPRRNAKNNILRRYKVAPITPLPLLVAPR
jgi:hypothetical protein